MKASNDLTNWSTPPGLSGNLIYEFTHGNNGCYTATVFHDVTFTAKYLRFESLSHHGAGGGLTAFQWRHEPLAAVVVSAPRWGQDFDIHHAFRDNCNSEFLEQWLAPDYTNVEFVLDFGSVKPVYRFFLKNGGGRTAPHPR